MPTNRTADWDRIRRAGFLRTIDVPGEIIVTGDPPLLGHPRLWFGLLGGFGALYCTLLALAGDQGAWLLVAFGGLVAVTSLWPFAKFYSRWAYKVTFRPDVVLFHNLFGVSLGGFERDGMKQIAVETRRYSPRDSFEVHVFYADTGYIEALPVKDAGRATLRNHLLLSAFQQPLHLDVAAATTAERRI